MDLYDEDSDFDYESDKGNDNDIEDAEPESDEESDDDVDESNPNGYTSKDDTKWTNKPFNKRQTNSQNIIKTKGGLKSRSTEANTIRVARWSGFGLMSGFRVKNFNIKIYRKR